jgi:D-3-phosphoglycerate dehydrogenase
MALTEGMNKFPASTATQTPRTVLLTDHPWPDLDIEREVIEGAGFRLVAGPEAAPAADEIEAMVVRENPSAIITCWAEVSAKAVMAPAELAIVARMGVGLDNIAVAAATERGAWVTNVPDYCVSEVADHALAMLLAQFRGIARLDAAVKARGWVTNAEGLERLCDLTVAIIGYGRIGRETGLRLQAFGCRVLANSVDYTQSDGVAEVADIARLQAEADVIVLHAPLLESTRKLVNEAFLAGLRRRPLIINVSRGGLIDNAALLAALEAGTLRGAALDVIDGEPAPPAELYCRSDVIVTPHVAFASTASMRELRRRACEDVVRALRHEKLRDPCNQPESGEPLPGGVASDIRIVQGPTGPEVVKKALAKLKVPTDWFSDPARSATEVAAIRAFAELIGPAHVPQILWSKPADNVFAMRLVEPRLRNWKQDLLQGKVDLETAHCAGKLLGEVHSRSAGRADIRKTFADTTYFQQLRIDPFFNKVAARLPNFATIIREVVAGMEQRKTALVHGDYSPKNILADGADVVILDFEVAHWGDPRFDVAFCASHLLLKTHRSNADKAAFTAAIGAFLQGYHVAGPEIDDADLARITGCLMLARFEGSSPVDYYADIDAPAARAFAETLLTHPEDKLAAHLGKIPELN